MTRTFRNDILKNWIETKGKGAREELAFKLKVSVSYIDKLVQGSARIPRVDVAQRLCNLTGMSFDELFPVHEDVA